MAYIIEIKILIDEPTEIEAKRVLVEDLFSGHAAIVDWRFGEIEPVDDEINDSIANETYVYGEAFR